MTSPSDFLLDLQGEAVPLVGAFLGGLAGTVYGGGFGGAAGSAAGEALTGGAQDAAVRLMRGQDVGAGEIALSRGVDAVFGLGIDSAMLASGRILRRGFSPGAGTRELDESRVLRQAVEDLRNDFGVEISMGDLSPGQVTGNVYLQRLESIMSSLPGGGRMQNRHCLLYTSDAADD